MQQQCRTIQKSQYIENHVLRFHLRIPKVIKMSQFVSDTQQQSVSLCRFCRASIDPAVIQPATCSVLHPRKPAADFGLPINVADTIEHNTVGRWRRDSELKTRVARVICGPIGPLTQVRRARQHNAVGPRFRALDLESAVRVREARCDVQHLLLLFAPIGHDRRCHHSSA